MANAYYNENDAEKAAWLRELIKAGMIAPGEVDERDINEIIPTDIAGFSQCHFFAGIGIWSYALRRAGWPDERPVWTGSCPCGPFSTAGKRKGFDDERHLWPAWFHLIQNGKRKGIPIFGEQVASPDGLAWLDLVFDDLEGASYTLWPFDLCAAGFGAPHIRQRLFFLAFEELGNAVNAGLERHAGNVGNGNKSGRDGTGEKRPVAKTGIFDELGNPNRATGRIEAGECDPEKGKDRASGNGDSFVMADNETGGQRSGTGFCDNREDDKRRDIPSDRGGIGHNSERPGPTNGFWRIVDWLFCRDGKWRPVEPGTFPLVNGASARMVRLRGYGDGIVTDQAAAFIEEAEKEMTAYLAKI